MSIKYTRRLFKVFAPFAIGYSGYQLYWDSKAPPKYDFSAKKGSPKHIVVVGSGLAGLLAAYYLSNYEYNRITVLERDTKHYQGTSY